MIRGYSDHAANERTFLAWVRTAIAVIAFGFVIEKFNLFIRSLASVAAGNTALPIPIGKISGPLGRDEGIALIVGGAVLIAVATFRFVRITRLLDDAETHAASSVRTELVFSSVLLLGLAGFSIYLLIG
jgi:putative membrane protein